VASAAELLFGSSALTLATEGFFDPNQHPRAAAGSANGGQFGVSSTGASAKQQRIHAPSALKPHLAPKGGAGKGKAAKRVSSTLSFNPKTGVGSGYGVKGGDSRVKALQTALNRLGVHDKAGAQVIVDGRLGPLTAGAVKTLQAKLGLSQTGQVTARLLARLEKLQKLPAPRVPRVKKAVKPKATKLVAAKPVKAAPVKVAHSLILGDSPALRRWTEGWDPGMHPRGYHGRFGRGKKVVTTVGPLGGLEKQEIPHLSKSTFHGHHRSAFRQAYTHRMP